MTELQPGAIVATKGDGAAVIMVGSGETVTYRELDERSKQVAQRFRAVIDSIMSGP